MANETNGGNQGSQPSLNVLAQYLKDFSFENPGAPANLRASDKPPEISIEINVSANPLSETDVEVELKLDAKATGGDDKPLFLVDLTYAGVFRLTNIPAEQMHPLVLVECPRLLFPFARQIVAESTRNGGFPPLMIDPVDFFALYRQRMGEAQLQPGATRPA